MWTILVTTRTSVPRLSTRLGPAFHSQRSAPTARRTERPNLRRRHCGSHPTTRATTSSQGGFPCSGGTRRTGRSEWKRQQSSTTASTTTAEASSEVVQPPTREELMQVFGHAAVPMIGFGIMDQTIMIHAGNAIDCTLGVLFGLSTLTAAAFGQICSDASGVLFGGTVERLAKRAGMPSPNLSLAQTRLPVVARYTLAGSFVGIVLGCTIGLVNLLFIDTSRSSTLKLQAFHEGQDAEFTIEATNTIRPDATALTVQGPDLDGVLASMTTAIAKQGCSIVEISAKYATASEGDNQQHRTIRDVFYVVNSQTGEPLEDDELEIVAQAVLDSTRTPVLGGRMEPNQALTLLQHPDKPETDDPLDFSLQKKIQSFQHRLDVVRSKETAPPSHNIRRRISVVRHLPMEAQTGGQNGEASVDP